MIVVDVLLGLNFVALGVCALRGQSHRRLRVPPVRVDDHEATAGSRAATGNAVIIPFRPRRAGTVTRAMAFHPSAGHGAPSHR